MNEYGDNNYQFNGQYSFRLGNVMKLIQNKNDLINFLGDQENFESYFKIAFYDNLSDTKSRTEIVITNLNTLLEAFLELEYIKEFALDEFQIELALCGDLIDKIIPSVGAEIKQPITNLSDADTCILYNQIDSIRRVASKLKNIINQKLTSPARK